MRVRYVIIFLSMMGLLCGCSSLMKEPEESTIVEETLTIESTIEEASTIEESSIVETETQEETSTEDIKEDMITYYDYGYDMQRDVVIEVDSNLKVSISSSKNSSDFYEDKYGIYYWTDKNTLINDTTSGQLKEGVPAFLYTRDKFDKRWEYVLLFGEDNRLVKSDYGLRVMRVSYIKDNEAFEDKFIICFPSEALFLRESLDVKGTYKNRLMLKSQDGNHRLHIDLEEIIYKGIKDSYVVSDNNGWECMVISYDDFFKSYQSYMDLIDFYMEAKLDDVEVPETEEVETEQAPEIDYKVNCPLGAEEFNLLILDNLKDNIELYINSVIGGRYYKYVIFTVNGNTYETIVASDKPVNENEINFEAYANKQESILFDNNDSRKFGICDYSEFINNADVSLKLISNVFTE